MQEFQHFALKEILKLQTSSFIYILTMVSTTCLARRVKKIAKQQAASIYLGWQRTRQVADPRDNN